MRAFITNVLLLSVAVITGCEIGQRIYRADTKLLVTTAGETLPVSNLVRENDDRFFGTQIDIMLSQTLLRRTQQRMKKTADELQQNLTDLKVTRVSGTDIIMISVDSPSPDFARDFADALADEFLRFRDEQRAQTAESALLLLTREINRLSQELKSANERVLTYAKEHKVAPTADEWDLQMLREDRDRVRELYNVLLGQLMKIDATQSFSARHVSVLEPAIVEPKPVHGWTR